jgi:hypothetical protein
MTKLIRENSVSKSVIILAVVILAVPGFTGLSIAVDQEDNGIPEWTIALFINADNNLEICYDDFTYPWLCALPDNDEVDIVSWVDRLSTTGYEMIEFSGEDTTVSYVETELGFGLSSTLRDFLIWTDTEHPSENLAVIMWDHGSAWRSFSSDDTDGSRMYGPDLDQALREADIPLDILGFDACSMSSMERLYEVGYSGYVDIMVASEELVPGNGFPYDLMFTPLIQDSTRTPVQVAGDMVMGWESYYHQSQRVNLAAIDVNKFMAAMNSFSEWTDDMIDGIDLFKNAYNHAAKDAYADCGTQFQLDMIDLAEILYEELARCPESDERTALSDSTLGLTDALKDSVIAISTSAVTRDTHGMTVYWGWYGSWNSFETRYLEPLWFPNETGWGEFLELFNLK